MRIGGAFGVTCEVNTIRELPVFLKPATTGGELQRQNIMEFITDLWIPILVGTFALQFASTMAWMVLPHHFGDHATVPSEADLMDWVSDQEIPAGSYMFPYPETAAEMNSKEHQERYAKGPRGTLHVYSPVSMPLNILKTLLYFFCTVGTIAYITHVACPPGAETTTFLRVFRIAGTIGVLTYASSGVLDRIWFVRRMWTTMVDGVVFGLIVGIVFAVLWPAG